ncbi:putative uncharacterized protein DDB_G0277255, partial [Musca vetustissima]|uniref:putative uncharacterized protein DDB_G0277255 n=1 Tax=Musca vetustissima TaxID=27455 RepID=UPI002AB6DAC7
MRKIQRKQKKPHKEAQKANDKQQRQQLKDNYTNNNDDTKVNGNMMKLQWSKLQVTCQQLDCMQRHAEGHGNLWHKQAIVLNENHHYQHQLQQQQQHHQQKTDTHLTSTVLSSSAAAATGVGPSATNTAILSTSSSAATTVTALTDTTMTTTTTADVEVDAEAETSSAVLSAVSHDGSTTAPPSSCGSSLIKTPISSNVTTLLASPVDVEPVGTTPPPQMGSLKKSATHLPTASIAFNHHHQSSCNSANTLPASASLATTSVTHSKVSNSLSSSSPSSSSTTATAAAVAATSKASSATQPKKPNDWVVIPVFADIVKLALAGREDCLQR